MHDGKKARWGRVRGGGAERAKASASPFAITAGGREGRELLDPTKREAKWPRDDSPMSIVPLDYERLVLRDKG